MLNPRIIDGLLNHAAGSFQQEKLFARRHKKIRSFAWDGPWLPAYRRYSHDYVRFEDEAKAAGAGIWSSQFVMPWDWRRGQRIVQDETVSSQHEGYDIKGSINSRGEKIYHMPRAPSYERPRIDKSRGQRWFCSEDEACEAGWRRSGQ
jgi:hypothetical protein